MTGGHRDNSRRALARTACQQLTRLIADVDPNESGELPARLSGKAASAVDNLWPQLLRAHEWLKERTDDEEAAYFSVRLSLGREALESRTRNSLDTHLRWLQTGLSAAYQTGDHSNAAKITSSIAETLNARGDHTLAVEYFERALRYSQGDSLTCAQDFDGLAYALARLGWAKEAQALFTAALRLFRDIGHSHGEIVTLINLAEANVLWGDGQAALSCLRSSVPVAGYTPESKRILLDALCLQGEVGRALDLATRFESRAAPQTAQVQAEALLLRSRVRLEGGDTAAAAQDLRRARPLAEHGGDLILLQDVLALLGRVESALGNHKRAMRLLSLRSQQAAQLGTRHRWESLHDLGEAAAAADDTKAAVEYHQKALDLAESDVRFVTAYGLTRLAVQFQLPEGFAEDPEASAAMGYLISDRRSVSQSLAALADLTARRGKDDAWDTFEEAHRAASEDAFQRERVLDRAGQAAYDKGDYERAFSYQERRAASIRDRGLLHALAHAVGACADACLALERNEQAMRLYEEVVRLDREIGDYSDEVHATHNIGVCLSRLGEMDQALEHMRYAGGLAACCGYRRGRLIVLISFTTMTADAYEALSARALAQALAAELGERELGERLRTLLPVDLSDRALAEALAAELGERELGERLRTLLPMDSSEEQRTRAAELGGRCNREALAMARGGQTEPALHKLTEALRWTALCPGEHRQMCTILMNLGNVALQYDDDTTASASFMDAEAQATLLGDPSVLDDSQWELANVLGTRLGNPKAAVEVLLRLYERYSAGEPPPLRALTSLIHFEIQLPGWVDEDAVREHLYEALNICRSQGEYAVEIDLLSHWSDLLEQDDRYAEAVDAHRRALFLAERHAPERVDTVREALERLRARYAQHDQQDKSDLLSSEDSRHG